MGGLVAMVTPSLLALCVVYRFQRPQRFGPKLMKHTHTGSDRGVCVCVCVCVNNSEVIPVPTVSCCTHNKMFVCFKVKTSEAAERLFPSVSAHIRHFWLQKTRWRQPKCKLKASKQQSTWIALNSDTCNLLY